MIDAEIHKTLNKGMYETNLHVHLKAAKGSITLIYGPSGAGKTTFLKILAGLMKPEKGKIVVDRETWLDVAANINLAPQKRHAGFVFQQYALFPNMTIRQHLEYATKDAAWIKQLLKLGGLETYADRKPAYLSGGQQQRLAILRAMTNKPSLLLMDEPFSALDQQTKIDLIGELKALWDELKTTVVIVSHYPHELTAIATNESYIEST